MGMMLLVVEVTAMTVVMAAVTMLMAIAGGHGNMGGTSGCRDNGNHGNGDSGNAGDGFSGCFEVK